MRGFVFIDGSNFYHKLKALTAERKQDFRPSNFDDVRLIRPEDVRPFFELRP